MRSHESPRTRISAALLIVLSAVLAGCSMPIFAGMTVGELSVVGSLFSTAATGKGIGEHAMDAATGRDCNILEGLVREDRMLCERRNSPAIQKDWRGLASIGDGAVPPRNEIPPRDSHDGNNVF